MHLRFLLTTSILLRPFLLLHCMAPPAYIHPKHLLLAPSWSPMMWLLLLPCQKILLVMRIEVAATDDGEKQTKSPITNT